jgi:uncharacterized membrane protein
MENKLSEEEILKAFGLPKELFDEMNNETTLQSLEQFKEQFSNLKFNK